MVAEADRRYENTYIKIFLLHILQNFEFTRSSILWYRHTLILRVNYFHGQVSQTYYHSTAGQLGFQLESLKRQTKTTM